MVRSISKSNITAIVASGEPLLFQEWLDRSFLNLRGVSLVLVPWGPKAVEIRKLTPRGTLVCEADEDTTLENNRNRALELLRKNPPNLVGFLDDDAFVSRHWVEAMVEAAAMNPTAHAFASIVRSDGREDIQARGHILVEGAPRDRGYRGAIAEENPLCPCGNACVVRWEAIQRILAVDANVWDPLFRQWQTCFDFGLKLILTSSITAEAPQAEVEHRGYMMWSDEERERRGDNAVEGQLRSRILFYRKFFPDDLRLHAMNCLNIDKWRERGYPGFPALKGDRLDAILSSAKASAIKLAERQPDCWRIRMAKRKDKWVLAGFSKPA